MDNIPQLIKSYESTICSLRTEISSLTLQISEQDFQSSPESYLSTLNTQIDETMQKITDQSLILAHQSSTQEWIKNQYPQSIHLLELSQQLSSLQQNLLQARNKKLQEDSKLLSFQQLNTINPKLFNLASKLIQTERKNLKFKQLVSSSEDKKREIRSQYATIANAFAQEESIKKRIQEMEPKVREKEEIVKNLMKKLQITQGVTEQTIDRMEESGFKDMWSRCMEVRGLREVLAGIILNKKKDIEDLVNDIENTEKNPEKIPPATANKSLRKEIKEFERQISERSIEEKEKERIKFQMRFQLELKSKELKELKNHVKVLEGNMVTEGEIEEKIQPEMSKRQETLNSERKSLTLKTCESDKVFDMKRKTVIEFLGKGITDGMGETVIRMLKDVGKPGQGLASKVIELNRSQFNSQSSKLRSK